MRFIVALCFLISTAIALPYPLPKWTDPLGRKPISYQNYIKSHPRLSMSGRVISKTRSMNTIPSDLVLLVVADYIKDPLSAELSMFKTDLETGGYAVETLVWSGGDPSGLRDQIKTYLSMGLKGAILIGDLPVAWYQEGSEQFPVQLFYMDLDGTWTDRNSDGIYDEHTKGSGSLEPEVWIGWLSSSNLTWGDEITLLKDYFVKNHAYREGKLRLPYKALLMIDDDWHDWAGPDAEEGMGYLYGKSNLKVCNTGDTYNAARWKAELSQGYEWAMIMAHSCPWMHSFYANESTNKGSVTNIEIFDLQPKAFFYNLFACSNVRVVEDDCLGNWYIFGEQYGLTVVGAAKSGSMLYFQDFFSSVAANNRLGEAFKSWFIKYGEDDRAWFYGNAILGDPTLIYKNGGVVSNNDDPFDPIPDKKEAWSDPVRITTDKSCDANPIWGMTMDCKPMLVYESGRQVRSDLFYSVLDGDKWSEEKYVFLSEYWGLKPTLAFKYGQKPFIIWAQYNGSNSGYDLGTSEYSGSSWVYKNYADVAVGYDLYPRAVFDDENNIHLVWVTYRRGRANIAYRKRSTTGGWSSLQYLTSHEKTSKEPFMFLNNNKPVLCYITDNKAYMMEYKNDWQTEVALPFDPSFRYSMPIGISTGNGSYIFLAKGLGANGNNLYALEGSLGNWKTPVKLTNDNSAPCDIDLVRDGEDVHIVYGRKSHGRQYYLITWKPDLGFGSREELNLPFAGSSPKLYKSNGRLFVAFNGEQDNNLDIYVMSKAASGFEKGSGVSYLPAYYFGIPYPNPARTNIGLVYNGLNPNTPVRVYDLQGRLVYESNLKAGKGKWLWNLRDKSGREIGSGVYIIRCNNEIRKLVKL